MRSPTINQSETAPIVTVARDETLNKHLTTCKQQVDSVQNQFVKAWFETFRGLVEKYRAIDDQCMAALDEQLKGDLDFHLLLEKSESIIQQFITLTQSFPDVNADYSLKTILDKWQQGYAEATSGASGHFSLRMPKRALQKDLTDSALTGFWKGGQRARLKIWETWVALDNLARRITKRKTRSTPRFKRTVRYGSFLESMILVPIEDALHRRWKQIIAELTDLLQILNDDTHQRVLDLMLLDHQNMILDKKSLNLTREKLTAARQKQPRFEEIKNRLDDLEKHSIEHIGRDWDEILARTQAAWPYIGTLLYPNLIHHAPRLRFWRNQRLSRVEKQTLRWKETFDGEREERLKDLELAALQARIPLTMLETLVAIRDQITGEILPAFANPYKVISDTLKSFQASESETEAKLRRDILSQNRLLLRDLRREMLPRILESIQKARLPDRLQNLVSRVRYLTDQLPESHSIFRNRSARTNRGRFITVELKALVLADAYQLFNTEMEAFITTISSHNDKLSRDVTEIDQIIEFNLGAALELLSTDGGDKNQESAYKVVTEGLERARNQLTTLIEESQELSSLCQETLPRISQQADLNILELVNNEKIVELQFRITRAKLRESFHELRRKIFQFIMSLWPRFYGVFKQGWNATVTWYRRLRNITGLSVVAPDGDERLRAYLTETRRQIASLPFVYQRTFRFEPMSDERFFIGRQQELEQIKLKYEQSLSGEFSATALVGESGSGRTSLLDVAAQSIFSGKQLSRVDMKEATYSIDSLLDKFRTELALPDVQSFEELMTTLNESASKRVIIVENIQHMFLRTVNGFEAMRQFLLLISSTSTQVFWVVSCGLYAWQYMRKVVNIDSYFQHVITLKELDAATIENVIMKRHRVSGFQIEFEAPSGITRSRRYKKANTDIERQKLLRELFFEQLKRLAAGNLTVAILFWLKSIKEIKADRFIIAPVIDFDPSFLAQLPAIDLFTFAAFLQHETLRVDQLAQVFHQDVTTSLHHLKRLENRGILVKKSTGYQIHYLMYRPVVKTLKIHNILS